MNARVQVIFYSIYGHVHKIAEAAAGNTEMHLADSTRHSGFGGRFLSAA